MKRKIITEKKSKLLIKVDIFEWIICVLNTEKRMCKISTNEYLCFSVISLTYTKENRWLLSQLSWAKKIMISNIPFKTILIRNSLNPDLTWHIWYFWPTLNLHSNLEFCGFEKHKTKPNLLKQSKTQLIWINSPSRAEPSRAELNPLAVSRRRSGHAAGLADSSAVSGLFKPQFSC